MALCWPKKEEKPIYNRIDADDISIVLKGVKQIKEQIDNQGKSVGDFW